MDSPKGHRAEHKQFPYRTGTENPVIAVVIKYNLLDRNEIKIKVLLSSEFTLYPWLHNRFPRPSQNKQKKRKKRSHHLHLLAGIFAARKKRSFWLFCTIQRDSYWRFSSEFNFYGNFSSFTLQLGKTWMVQFQPRQRTHTHMKTWKIITRLEFHIVRGEKSVKAATMKYSDFSNVPIISRASERARTARSRKRTDFLAFWPSQKCIYCEEVPSTLSSERHRGFLRAGLKRGWTRLNFVCFLIFC